MIYNKSIHPVEVKKISIRMWTLRSEIEAAISRRMKECEAAGVPLYIEDIKAFYNLKNGTTPATSEGESNVLPLQKEDSVTSLMESISAEQNDDPLAIPEADPLSTPPEANAGEAVNTTSEVKEAGSESKNLSEAEAIIAEQTQQGLENKKPNPILERPYTRQAPDLDQISYGFTFLSDMNMDQLLTFTKDKFLQGQSIVIEFLIPQGFKMSADVAVCNHYAMRSKIISSTKPDYRVQCRFTFAISGERDTLRNFLKSIEPTIMHERKKKKSTEEDSLGI